MSTFIKDGVSWALIKKIEAGVEKLGEREMFKKLHSAILAEKTDLYARRIELELEFPLIAAAAENNFDDKNTRTPDLQAISLDKISEWQEYSVRLPELNNALETSKSEKLWELRRECVKCIILCWTFENRYHKGDIIVKFQNDPVAYERFKTAWNEYKKNSLAIEKQESLRAACKILGEVK